MTFDFAYSFSTLDIPTVAGPLVTIVGGIAGALVLPLLVIEMVNEQTRALLKGDRGSPRFIRTLAITFIVMITSLLLYKWIFLKIVGICEAIGFALFKADLWGTYVEQLVKSEQGQVNIMQLNTVSIAAGFFSVVLNVIDGVFLLIRFVILSVLYVIGPLAIVGGISSVTRSYTKGWFKMVFMVSFWVVLFRALQGTMMAVMASTGGTKDSLAAPIVVGIVVTLFSIRIHHFTEALFGSGFVGAIADGAMGAFVNQAAAIGSTGADAGKAGVQAVKGSVAAVRGGINAFKGVKSWIGSKMGGGKPSSLNKENDTSPGNSKPKLR